ncbi:acyl-homoserine-lactone synthase [Rhodovulum marinum]|uniref:Acyl homoserine lactone synthase n=1 Tax=Rhodovulum marinum TaxID=320662 RepID=A0A4R2Q5P0_9RHOB|nr:acyl-homoserine-lactone synthase [Rhodovulum marinum]TCP44122.1 acyl homoserine lactone synthase [Rhodovulum marinum]
MSEDQPIELAALRLPFDHRRWNLVTRFLALRKSVFIDRLKWDLYHVQDLEFEQYDYLGAVYIVAHRGTEVVGGARLLRTDWRYGRGKYVYSYMIRDAWLGLLPGLPREVCADEPPVSAKVWELTRLAAMTPGIAADVLTAANAYLAGQNAEECLFLGPTSFMRMARSMGYQPRALGAITGNKDGRFIAFGCGVRHDLSLENRPPAAVAA